MSKRLTGSAGTCAQSNNAIAFFREILAFRHAPSHVQIVVASVNEWELIKRITSCPLDTGSSGVGSTVENSSAVGSEPVDNEDFFFFLRKQKCPAPQQRMRYISISSSQTSQLLWSNIRS